VEDAAVEYAMPVGAAVEDAVPVDNYGKNMLYSELRNQFHI
jgi:hypothetical protein